MNKAIATTALAATLALSLSGCTFGLLPPGPKPAPVPVEISETDSGEVQSDDASSTDTSSTDTGSGDSQNAHCEDGESVEITTDSYAGGYLYISGNCNSALVSADNLTISFESVNTLTVAGLYNTVDVSSSIGELAITGDANSVYGGGAGSLNVDGYSNVVSFDSADSVWVGGTENAVSWYGGAASGTDAGIDNILSAP